MADVTLTVPDQLLEALPADSDATHKDIQRAVDGWERRINEAIAATADDHAAADVLLDILDVMEARVDRYDQFIPELRAWGQSPIYAITWRNLYAALIDQLKDHDTYGPLIDRERNARLVEDGIRWGNID